MLCIEEIPFWGILQVRFMHNDCPKEESELKSPVHISDDEFSFADVKPTLAEEPLAETEGGLLDLDSVESLISNAESTAAQVLNPAPVDPGLAALAQAHAQANHPGLSPRHQVEAWLGAMVKSGASDLILRSGGKPSLRINGRITFLPGEVPGPGPMREILAGVLGEVRMQTWSDTGSADAGIQLDGLGRFRINAYKQMSEPAIVIRRINEDAPELGSLHLPSRELESLALRKRGLVFVTGVAGSGKSTTLAGMIQHINRNAERHIITLEDPVELIFKEDRCVISQREVGTDTPTFSEGLKHALRQSPDVILIGEARDAETVIAALEATETGHMVLCTMHTVNAAQTIERLLGFFPAERHVQIRQRMADTLGGVLSQRLIPDKSGGLRPAFELMMTTPHVKELISEGKTTELARVIESGTERGLISFNQCLLQMVQHGIVELDHALETSDRPEELLLALRGISAGNDRGKEATSGQNPWAQAQPAPGGPTLSKPRRANDDFPKGLK
ncbi:MAG: twitching motility protein PilU [Planctomycetota bacterium]|jgi:twitching motility protein PilU